MSLWKMVTMENDMSMYHYGKCHYGKCHYGKCHYGKRRGAYQSIEVLTKSHIGIQINNSFLVRISNYLPCRDSNCRPPSSQSNVLPTELSCLDNLPYNLYSGANHIPLFSQRPLFYHCSIGKPFLRPDQFAFKYLS